MGPPVQDIEGSISIKIQPKKFLRMRTSVAVRIAGALGGGKSKQVSILAHNVKWREKLYWQVYVAREDGGLSYHRLHCFDEQFEMCGGALQTEFDSTGFLELKKVGIKMTKITDKLAIKEELKERHEILELKECLPGCEIDPHKFKLAIRIVDKNGPVVCQPAFTTLVYNTERYGVPRIQEIYPKFGFTEGGRLSLTVTGGGSNTGKLYAEYMMADGESIKEEVSPQRIRTGTVSAVYPVISLQPEEPSRCVSVRMVTENGDASDPVDFIYKNVEQKVGRDTVSVPDHCSYDQIRELDALRNVHQYKNAIQPEVPSDALEENSPFATPQEVTGEDEDDMTDDNGSCEVRDWNEFDSVDWAKRGLGEKEKMVDVPRLSEPVEVQRFHRSLKSVKSSTAHFYVTHEVPSHHFSVTESFLDATGYGLEIIDYQLSTVMNVEDTRICINEMRISEINGGYKEVVQGKDGVWSVAESPEQETFWFQWLNEGKWYCVTDDRYSNTPPGRNEPESVLEELAQINERLEELVQNERLEELIQNRRLWAELAQNERLEELVQNTRLLAELAQKNERLEELVQNTRLLAELAQKNNYNLCRLTRKKRGRDQDDRSREQWRKIKRKKMNESGQEDVNHQPADGEKNNM